MGRGDDNGGNDEGGNDDGRGQGRGIISTPFLTPAETKIFVLLSALVKRFGVSLMQDF